ncbi:unnamed protein product, partial [Prorocentrum cordatum]
TRRGGATASTARANLCRRRTGCDLGQVAEPIRQGDGVTAPGSASPCPAWKSCPAAATPTPRRPSWCSSSACSARSRTRAECASTRSSSTACAVPVGRGPCPWTRPWLPGMRQLRPWTRRSSMLTRSRPSWTAPSRWWWPAPPSTMRLWQLTLRLCRPWRSRSLAQHRRRLARRSQASCPSPSCSR